MLVLGLYKEDYLQIFKCVSFWLLRFCCYWENWDSVSGYNQSGGYYYCAYRCVIQVLGGAFVIRQINKWSLIVFSLRQKKLININDIFKVIYYKV